MIERLTTAVQKFIFCYTITAGLPSFIRLLINTKKYRYAKSSTRYSSIPVPYHLRLNGKRKTIFLRTYTGDIEIFYEVFWKKVYHLPRQYKLKPEIVVDLGANTGMASLFFSVYYSTPGIYSVEADKHNVDILLSNLSAEVSAGSVNVMHAAIYNEDTTVYMQVKEKAYNTAIAREVTGMPVRAICMDTLYAMFKLDKIDLLKIDIEGSEEALFSENTGWLDKVNMIVMEIHAVSYRSTCEAILRNNGFVIDEPGKITSSSNLLWARKPTVMQ
ncbi:FkbM family methyltransferase [Agriterribacter sp.]|uniref:FkbM family methyltransferase n=1 Tax=Agriterribacter sp. TaxID=2821509 RepID=UPI002B932B87|nr:FkbM family methyltransferase [Agriterribacter sp.]HRO47097.1 FkbM family methyltransferase [Agriterribacter sp.]HRQ17854.1 FkbM family methyltransferase [Agriterribacter sp.]